MNPYRLKAYILLLIVVLIWGVASPVIKFTLGGISAIPFLTYRFALSSVVAIAIIVIKGLKIPRSPHTLALILFYGLTSSTISLGFLFLGMEKTTVLDMSLIASVNPLIIALAGMVFLKEHITKKEKLGMGIAFLGTFVTIIQPLLEFNSNLNQISGNILVFSYVLANTAAAITAKKLLRLKISSLHITGLSFIIGFVTLLPFAFFNESTNIIDQIIALPFQYHAGVWFMALISGTLAYTLWVKAQKSIEVGEAGLFSYLLPLIAAPIAVIWLDERITLPFVIGAVLILTGVTIAEIKTKNNNS